MKSLSATVGQIDMMNREIRMKVNKLESFALFDDKTRGRKKINIVKLVPIVLKTSKLGKFSETPDGLNDVETSKPKKKSIIRFNDSENNIKPCVEYFINLETERNQKANEMASIHDSIGPIMIKLESLILRSFTGASEKMSHYYTHWEREMFSSLMRFTTRNLQEFSEKLIKNEVKMIFLLSNVVDV